MNVDIHNALEQSVLELMASSSSEVYGEILELCQRIKFEVVTAQLNPSSIAEIIWTPMRNNKLLLLSVLSCASTFVLNQAEYEYNLNLMARSVSIIQSDSIADSDFMQGCIGIDEAYSLMKADGWLFWLLTLSLSLRFVTNIPKPVKGGHNVS